MSLGQIIRNKRRELGLTLDEVSAKTGFSKPYLSTIENEKVKNPPSDELMRKLEGVFGITPGTLRQMANLNRAPADVREQFEASRAENERWRKLVRDLMDKKVKNKELNELLSENKLDVQIPTSSRAVLFPLSIASRQVIRSISTTCNIRQALPTIMFAVLMSKMQTRSRYELSAIQCSRNFLKAIL
jgi:transcriptional regulator with XRE-family HTH domain